MSEHVGKHVFDADGSFAFFRGTVARETEAMWFLTNGRRMAKSGTVLVDGSRDPRQAADDFRAAFRDNEAPVDAAREAFRLAAQGQRMAAIAALKGEKP